MFFCWFFFHIVQSNHDGNINEESGLVDDIVLLFLSGAIEHQDRPYTSVQFFTQAEINQGQILYRPPMAPSHLRELYLYSFTGEWDLTFRNHLHKDS